MNKTQIQNVIMPRLATALYLPVVFQGDMQPFYPMSGYPVAESWFQAPSFDMPSLEGYCMCETQRCSQEQTLTAEAPRTLTKKVKGAGRLQKKLRFKSFFITQAEE